MTDTKGIRVSPQTKVEATSWSAKLSYIFLIWRVTKKPIEKIE